VVSRAEAPAGGTWSHRFVHGDELAALAARGTSVYQQAAWARAVQEGVGYRPVGVVSEGRGPAALVVWFETRRGSLRLIGSPLPGCFTPFQRPVWLESGAARSQCDVLRGQLGFLRAQGYASIEWVLPGADPDIVAMARHAGASVHNVPTILVDVDASADAMWKKMESRGRNMARKAEKAGVVVHRCVGSERETAEFYRMLQGTFAKSGIRPPHPFGLYRALVHHLVRADRLLFLAAKAGDRTLAMALFVHDDHEIFFTSGTSLPGVGAYAPNNLIQWHAIQFAVERGLRLYDLGGTGRPSIDRFKTSLGGRPHTYVRVIWRAPIMRAVASAYFLARPVLERARFLSWRLRPGRP